MTDYKTAILAGINAVDDLIAKAIQEELSALLPAYELAESQAAEDLRTAVAALDEPQKVIAELRDELDNARQQSTYWEQRALTGNYHDRTESRVWVNSYGKTISEIDSKIRQAESAYEVLLDKRDAAQRKLHDASEAHSDFQLNTRFPFVAYGQQTEAYKVFRLGSWSLHAEIMAANLLGNYHPERDQFRVWQDELSRATGYSTDDLQQRMRQQAREESARNLDEVLPERAHAPSGQDIIAETTSAMEHAATAKANDRSRVEDYRYPVPSGVKVPRPEMQVDTAARLRGR